MEISSNIYDNKLVVLEVTGDVDAHTAKTLNKTLTDFLAQGHSRIVIDVSQITLISSAGLRAILFAHREALQLGGEVRLSGPSAQTKRIFEISGLYELITISEALQDALDGWQ